MTTLLKNVTVIPMTRKEYFFKGDILIKDEKIAYAGPASDLTADEVKDMTGFIALPGFVNAHTHLAMTLMRNYKDRQSNLQEWLSEIFPIEDKLTDEDIYSGDLTGLVEMIKSGTTCFADMYFSQWKTAEAVKMAGIRGVLGLTFFGDEKESERRIREIYPRIQEAAGNDPLIRIDAAPHAIYTCTGSTYQTAAEFAKNHGGYVNTHLSETAKEVEDCITEHGMRPVEYLDELGIFSSPCYLAHGVHFDDNELGILRKHGVSVVHNPSSNCKLASGICDIGHYRNMGVNVCLGTDGASSNNNLSMVKEMRLAAMLATISTMKPASTTPYEILEMATVNGARALGLDDRIGTIEEGKDADILLINAANASMTPLNNIFSAIVFSMPEEAVDTLYCRGRLLMQGRKLMTLDENNIIRDANEKWEALLKR